MGHSLRLELRGITVTEIPGWRYRARYIGNIRSHESGKGGPQRLRAKRPGRRGADIREILRGGVICRQQEKGRRIQGRKNTEKTERDGASKMARLRRQGSGKSQLGSSKRYPGTFGSQRMSERSE